MKYTSLGETNKIRRTEIDWRKEKGLSSLKDCAKQKGYHLKRKTGGKQEKQICKEKRKKGGRSKYNPWIK
jgi:hypothetical protein